MAKTVKAKVWKAGEEPPKAKKVNGKQRASATKRNKPVRKKRSNDTDGDKGGRELEKADEVLSE